MRDRDCVDFLQWALPRMRLRWAGFRKVRRQICRRIAARLSQLGLPDPASYRRVLEESEAEWAILDRLCRVTISRFYRDRGVFDAIRARVLPELAAQARQAGRRRVRAWSAGCASGEEPYSLALSWILGCGFPAEESADALRLEIVATDRDARLLARARRACYPVGCLRELPEAWRRRAFRTGNGACRLRDRYRQGVRLVAADVRRPGLIGRFDLVLCRNLAFTYFDDELQREMVEGMAARLRPGGVLVIGGHESLPGGGGAFRPLTEARASFRKEPPVEDGTGRGKKSSDGT